MKPLRPTLWRTCRVIASTTRLRLLWKIFGTEGLCIDELARATGVTRPNATIQLRALNSRGLIAAVRDGKKIIYRAEANPGVDFADELLSALHHCFTQNIPIRKVFQQATAFTHSRRIGLIRVACGTFDEIVDASGMSHAALQWNLAKLVNRGFLKVRSNGRYEPVCPKNPLGACLMKIALADQTALDIWGRITIVKVVSGGQTGADRAALDAAIACGIPHGGWCPKGRRSEDGSIPAQYNLRETESEEYPVRTRMNVEAADLTLIFTRGPLTGGSLLTLEFAKAAGKPCVYVDLLEAPDGFQLLEKTVRNNVPRVGDVILNVAGPRSSNDPEIYGAVYSVMVDWLGRFNAPTDVGEPACKEGLC
jgi:DNA-binding transcriptional ArsR family regulator